MKTQRRNARRRTPRKLTTSIASTTTLSEVELNRIATLPEACHLSSLSEDSLRRYHADKIIRLSPKRSGMRVRDALMIGQGGEQ
jgi:hypothetical protein